MSEHEEPVVALYDPGEVGRAEHNRGDRLIVGISNIVAWLFPILMLAICSQVLLRASGMNQAWLDDLQWWLYGVAVLVGVAYAVTTNSHVRVDIFFDNYPKPKQTRIDIFGLVWLFLPFVILCWDFTLHYAVSSVAAWEGSDSPNGLHNLWILKVLTNLSFVLIGIAVWSAYVRLLSRLTKPVLWKKLLYAFPSIMFLVNLAIFYAIFWVLRLTTPAEVKSRALMKSPIFGEIEIGSQEIHYTVIAALVLTVIIILVAKAFDRGEEA